MLLKNQLVELLKILSKEKNFYLEEVKSNLFEQSHETENKYRKK